MRDLKTQFVSALLFILTVAAVCCAVINFRHQKLDTIPEDGAIWVDRTGADGKNLVKALHVTPGGQADNAGIRSGDTLLEISGRPIQKSTEVPAILKQIGAWSQARYELRRGSVELPAQVIIGQRVPDRAIYYQYAVGAHLPDDRVIRVLPARQRAPLGSLLRAVPGIVRACRASTTPES